MFAKGSLGNLSAENQVGNICLFCKLMIDEVPTLYLCSLGSRLSRGLWAKFKHLKNIKSFIQMDCVEDKIRI